MCTSKVIREKNLHKAFLISEKKEKCCYMKCSFYMHQKLEENNDTNSRLHAARNIKSIYTYTEYAGTNSYLPKKKPTQ